MAKKVVPAPKKKSDGSSQRAESTRQMKARPKKSVDRMPSPAKKPTAAFVVPGQQATGLASGPGAGRPSYGLNPRTPVTNMNTPAGRSSLRGMQGPIHPDSFMPVATGAAGFVAGLAGSGASSMRIVRQVPSIVKDAQRVLSDTQRYYSGKDVRNLPRSQREDVMFNRLTRDYEDASSPSRVIAELRQNVSQLAKANKGKLKIVRR